MMVLGAAVFCLAGFGWGMARHFRRSGPPTGTMLAVALCALVSAGLNIFGLSERTIPHPAIAVSIYAAGAVLFWWAVSVSRGKLAACGQGCVSCELLAAGPYRFVRHPFYTAYNLVWWAGFIATGWWLLGLSAVAMAAIYERCAREEERGFLSGPLREQYRRYAFRTGRYFPKLRCPPALRAFQ